MKHFISLLFILFFSCSKPKERTSDKTTLLVSLPPYLSVVQKVAGEEFDVKTLVPEGANPHMYEPTAKQLSEVKTGSVWFRLGEPFEKKALPWLLEHNQNLIDADLREGAQLIHGSCCSCGSEDRHLWLSPKEMVTQVNLIEKVLISSFPEKKESFQENAKALISDLKMLDDELKKDLDRGTKRALLVPHAAFSYFCKDYGYRQVALEHEGKDPTPRYLSDVMSQKDEINVAISMPQHSNRGLHLVADKLSLPVRKIDPYGKDLFQTLRELKGIILEEKNERD